MNLQKLAEKINERWGSEWHSCYYDSQRRLCVSDFRDVPRSDYVNLNYYNRDDSKDVSDNAHWIIWCLDRLEELHRPNPNFGLTFSVDVIGKELGGSEDDYCVQVIAYPRNGDAHAVDTAFPAGKTRAEAVTLALAKALGVEDE